MFKCSNKYYFILLLLLTIFILNSDTANAQCALGSRDEANKLFCDIDGTWKPMTLPIDQVSTQAESSCTNNYECLYFSCIEGFCQPKYETVEQSLIDRILDLFKQEPTSEGGGSRRRRGPKLGCIEDWQCTSWSECVNQRQKRICSDLNDCETTFQKPLELRSCEVLVITPSTTTTTQPVTYYSKPTKPKFPWALLIAILLILLAIFMLILAKLRWQIWREKVRYGLRDIKRKRMESEEKKREIKLRLRQYIADALAKGYNKEQIKNALIKADWPEDLVDRIIKRS